MSNRLEKGTKRALCGLWARSVARPALTVDELPALSPARILIVRQHNQMGDMICATPCLRAIKEAFPSAELGLVTSPVNGAVVVNNPHLGRVFSFTGSFWRRPAQLLEFRKQVRGFGPDLAFVLSSVSFSVTSAWIAAMSGARFIVGAESLPFGWDLSRLAFSLEMPSIPVPDRPAVDHNLAPLEAVGLVPSLRSPEVRVTADDRARAAAVLEGLGLTHGFWALHPGAGKRQNIWPPERFAEVARRAAAQGHPVLILHGPADAEPLAAMKAELGSDGAGSAGILTAPDTAICTGAAILERADRFLCNDTGVMHLAGALGVPTVALFGPTDPDIWKPPSHQVVAFRSRRQMPHPVGGEFGWMEGIDTDEVFRAWSELPGRRAANTDA